MDGWMDYYYSFKQCLLYHLAFDAVLRFCSCDLFALSLWRQHRPQESRQRPSSSESESSLCHYRTKVICGSVDAIVLETIFAETMTHKCLSYLMGSKQIQYLSLWILFLCSHLVYF